MRDTDYFDLGDGYELRLEWAMSDDWYYAKVFAPRTADEDSKIKIAQRSVRRHQARDVRWAKKRKRIHMRARELARA